MDLTHASYAKVKHSWQLLKITYGLFFIIAGADKFFNMITLWPQYVSPLILNMIPVSFSQFMMGIGVMEVIIGLLIFCGMTRIGAYLAMIWLLVIVVNLLSMGMFFDIAVRDTVMAVGAFVLALLCDVQEEVSHKPGVH